MKANLKNIIALLLLVMNVVFLGSLQVLAEDTQRTISTVTASTNHISYPPEYSIDGITTTRWQHLSFDLKPSVLFDFGKRTSFNKIVVLPSAALAVKEFKIEAADNPEMTKNRITLASGTSLKDENVFSFVRVSRRYIKYTVTKKDASIGLLEFTVFENKPYAIEFSQDLLPITIPTIGGTDEVVPLTGITVKDTQGHLVHSSNYDLIYSLESTQGVSVSEEGIVTVTEEAQEQDITVRVAVKSDNSVYMDIPISLIKKENLLWQKDVIGNEELSVINDGRIDTYFEPEEGLEAVFDLGNATDINKLILVTKNYTSDEKIKISAALNEDFSDEIQLADVGNIQDADMVIPIERKNARYIKLAVEEGSGIRICELEAYCVTPERIALETNYIQGYIPGFDDESASTIAGIPGKVVDIYGDEVYSEFSEIIWSTTYELPQGVTLNPLNGELTVEPEASSTTLELLASCAKIESINTILTVELLEKPVDEDHSDNFAYKKDVKSSETHDSFPARNAVDGLEGTRMQSISSVKNPYLIVDLGEEKEFNNIVVKFLNSSVVEKATIRAANLEEDLSKEKSIIAQIIEPTDNNVTIGVPNTKSRYIMLYFEDKDGTISITEFEIKRIYPAIIYAPQLPEIVKIPDEGEVITPNAEIEIRDKFGSPLVFDENDYIITAENIPDGVTLDTKTGALTVQSSAQEGSFDIRITSVEDETVYNVFSVVLTRSGDEEDEQSKILLEQAIKKFNILDYVPSAVADSDFTLPVAADNGISISYLESSDAMEIDSSGNTEITRGSVDVDVPVEVMFELDGNTQRITVIIKVAARKKVSTGSSSSGSGGGVVIAPIIKPQDEETEEKEKSPEYTEYSDIADLPWAEEYLAKLVERKIMNGSDGLLRPKSFITREEFVKMIVCAFVSNEQKALIAFEDVPDDSWYYGYIAIASQAEVVYGISDELFGTGLKITRQDAAVMSKRAVEIAGKKFKTGEATLFNDEAEIAEYAREAVLSLSSAGIINGDGNGSFLPDDYITRAEAATIICLLLEEGYDEE